MPNLRKALANPTAPQTNLTGGIMKLDLSYKHRPYIDLSHKPHQTIYLQVKRHQHIAHQALLFNMVVLVLRLLCDQRLDQLGNNRMPELRHSNFQTCPYLLLQTPSFLRTEKMTRSRHSLSLSRRV
jgi:hypothetical protein